MNCKDVDNPPFGDAKLFGVALDVSDDPFSLNLKHASMQAREQGMDGLPVDPYDALLPELALGIGLEAAGKFPVASWLGPRPNPLDRALVTRENMQRFLDDGGISELVGRLRNFVSRRILPSVPVMIGIDHSVTGGVLSALSEVVGRDKLSVVILDRHFDGIPLTVRMAPILSTLPGGSGPLDYSILGRSNGSEYCCGNFWAHLIESDVVMPEHLLFVGVADYPDRAAGGVDWENFRRSYLGFEEQGCGFFTLREFAGTYRKRLERFLRDKITTPYIYVSLDLDVGAYRCVHAARYMDGPGIDKKALLDTAQVIAEICQSGSCSLIGLDVMEFNMHLLGLDTQRGTEDQTIAASADFIGILTNWQKGASGTKRENASGRKRRGAFHRENRQ